MGVPATRKTDICTGHGCFPPRQSTSGSPNVFANNLPAKRVTDTYATHCCITEWYCSCHHSIQSAGSSTVFCNNLPWSGVGHAVACGSVNATGSPNIFIAF